MHLMFKLLSRSFTSSGSILPLVIETGDQNSNGNLVLGNLSFYLQLCCVEMKYFHFNLFAGARIPRDIRNFMKFSGCFLPVDL